MIELFRCSACRRSLPRDGFGKNRRTKNGLQNQCVECRRTSYPRYAEKSNAQRRARRAACPDVVRAIDRANASKPAAQARMREYARRYYATHREEIKDRTALYAAANHGKMLEWNRAYQRRNKDALRAREENRRARLAAAPGRGVTEAEWVAIVGSFEHRCAYCIRELAEGEATMDHVIALKSGGAHEPENVAPACKSCNSSKGNRDLHEWLWRIPRALRARMAA